MVIGAPAPRALLAKPVLSRSDFLHLLQPHFGDVSLIDGNLAVCSGGDAPFSLCNGDCFRVAGPRWSPSLQSPFPRHFPSLSAACRYGLWSRDLHIYGEGWVLLWRELDCFAQVLHFCEPQRWCSASGRLLPLMQAELEMWWPWFDSLVDDEVLHCLPANRPRPRDRECLRDRASQDGFCGHAPATVGADSAAAPRRNRWWLWVGFYLCAHCLMQRSAGIGWVMLSLLSCYLIAWGAPEWSGSASGNWEMCLQQACELQAVKTPLTPELVGSTFIISLTI